MMRRGQIGDGWQWWNEGEVEGGWEDGTSGNEMIGWGGVRCTIDVRFGRREDNGMMGFQVE